MQRIITYGVLIIGILIGIAHLKVGIKTAFVFSVNEPILAWVFVLSGPLSTLPAAIVAFFWPKIGGMWLVVGSLLSLIAVAILGVEGGDLKNIIVRYFISYSTPMLMLGLVALLKDRFILFRKGH